LGCQVVEYAGKKDLWSVSEAALLPRGASGGVCAGLGASFAAALLEAIAIAVHLRNVNVMGKSVEQGAQDASIAKYGLLLQL
jgi:hypothetical protein